MLYRVSLTGKHDRFSVPQLGYLLGLPAIDSVTPATNLDWKIGVGKSSYAEVTQGLPR
jgi:hypothetical protein